MSDSCSSNDLVDIEEELDQFFVRKQSEENKEGSTARTAPSKSFANASSKYVVVHEYVPLLLCDVLSLDQQQYASRRRVPAHYAFDGAVCFRSCILYARVLKRLPSKGPYNKYMIDDGSAALKLNIHKRRKELEAIWRLQDEVNALDLHSVLQNKREICSSLRRLLTNTKEQLDTSNIPVGSNLLVYGRPNCFREEMCVDAFSIFNDSKISRDVEIAFKDELIHWYTRNYHRKGSRL